jgi:hypothetical protein
MLTVALNVFFCMAAAFIVVKFNGVKSALADGIFLMLVMVVMYAMNIEVLKKRCGASDLGVVAKATFLPWLLLGCIMAALRFMPGWKQPFSNTFGYLIVLFGRGKQKLRDMLQTDKTPSLKFVQDDPWSLLANFSTTSFDATLAALRRDSPIAEDKIEPFRKIVLLKDLMSELVWYMLVASVAITLSYTSMTAYKCQSINAAPIELPSEIQIPKTYFSE